MHGLAIKDVEFNGATLRAAQIEDIVWVGVKWAWIERRQREI